MILSLKVAVPDKILYHVLQVKSTDKPLRPGEHFLQYATFQLHVWTQKNRLNVTF